AGEATQANLAALASILEKLAPRKDRPIHGTIPYKRPSYTATLPAEFPTELPAYARGGDKTLRQIDFAPSVEAPITREIAAMAESLGWDPAAIYDFCRNTIAYEFSWGSQKGAAGVLRDLKGNGHDGASLLAAMLRAAGYGARLTTGVIEFFPGIQKARTLTGIYSPVKIAGFLQMAGIPYRPIVKGGQIVNFHIEHIWVTAHVPMKSRGGEKTWLPLCSSIKAHGYTYKYGDPTVESLPLDAIRDAWLQEVRDVGPLAYLKGEVETRLAHHAPDLVYDDLLTGRTLIPERLEILPSGMQFKQIRITNEFAHMPAHLLHRVRFLAKAANGATLLDATIPTLTLDARKTEIFFEPETVEDQEIINAHGGLDNTPRYLTSLRPVIRVDGGRLAVGIKGLPAGEPFQLAMELITPNETERVSNTLITGNLTVIGLAAGKPPAPAPLLDGQKDAAQRLHEAAMDYLGQWCEAEDDLAALLHLRLIRPTPAIISLASVIEATTLNGVTHDMAWKGVYIDVDLKTIEGVSEARFRDFEDPGRVFMELSSLAGSVLERDVIRKHFRVEAVSTASLFARANEAGLPMQTIDASNYREILPGLPLAENVKADMENAVAAGGLVVRTPGRELVHEAWTGAAYLKENRETGESGWMLSGEIAGGMSAVGVSMWPEEIRASLEHPYSEPAVFDPGSARTIRKITSSDRQNATVGLSIETPLQVLVKDDRLRPVAGAEVIFTIMAGGGSFPGGNETFTATTGPDGVARTLFIPGEKTSDNPADVWLPDEEHPHQAGENIIDAALAAGAAVRAPFIVYGLPAEPVKMVKLRDSASRTVLLIRSSLSAALEDKYGNPVANREITYTARTPVQGSECPRIDNPDAKPVMLVTPGNPCVDPIKPSYERCKDEGKDVLKVMTHPERGAHVYYFTGEIPACEYSIDAVYKDLVRTFTFETTMPPRASGFPPVWFQAGPIYHTDARGARIDAARVGEEIPIRAMVRAFMTESVEESKTYTCDGQSRTCPTLVPNGSFHWSLDFHKAEMTYRERWTSNAGTPLIHEGEGIFTTDYEVEPGFKVLYFRPDCSVIAPLVNNSCTGCRLEEEREFFSTDDNQFLMYFFGVDFEIEASGENNDEIIIPVDDQGYATCNTKIPFTITPPEYKAATAYMMIYRNGSLIDYLPVETEGDGFGVIAKGFRLPLSGRYEMDLVLNYSTEVEIRSDRIRLKPSGIRTEMKPVALLRTHYLSQFNASAPGAIGAGYTDDYQPIAIDLTMPKEVRVALLDPDRNEIGVIVPRTALPAGRHFFLVDFETVRNRGVDPASNPRFYIKVESVAEEQACTREIYYPGTLKERSLGRMLGQLIVHDVLIQDGSLNLSREDVALKGRGPALAFTRSYTSQPAARGFAPLGEGWRHGLDQKLEVLGFSEHGDDALPAWVRRNLGAFFSRAEIPPANQDWTSVSVYGTTFKKHNGYWTPERGRHGTLVEQDGAFIYTSKGGARYRYDYPYRPPGDDLLRASPPPPSPLRDITDRNGNTATFHYDNQERLHRVVDAVDRELVLHYAPVSTPVGPKDRLVRVTGPDEIELQFSYNEQALLEIFGRSDRVETYEYALQPGGELAASNLVKTVDSNGASHTFTYYRKDDIDFNSLANVKVLKAEAMVKRVTYPDGAAAEFAYETTTKNKRVVTNLKGAPTAYTLNYFGNPREIEEPGGRILRMTWSIDEGADDDVMLSKTDGRGFTTHY
ncbi:MAG: hypothetical protein GY867_00515, partial [bacterium]|nr:hypothetical protein [bacterium]